MTTHPAARHNAIPLAKCTLSRRSPSDTYAARRPAATHPTARVVDSTRAEVGIEDRVAEQSRRLEPVLAGNPIVEIYLYQPTVGRRRQSQVSAVLAHPSVVTVGPEHLLGERVGDDRSGDRRAEPHGDIDSQMRRASREIPGSAQRVDQPHPLCCRVASATGFFGDEPIGWTCRGEHREDGLLGSDIRVGREIVAPLAVTDHRSTEMRPNDTTRSLRRLNGQLFISDTHLGTLLLRPLVGGCGDSGGLVIMRT